MSNSIFGGNAPVMEELREVTLELDHIVKMYEFSLQRSLEDPDFIPPTYQIKIPAGGGKAFNISTGNEDLDTSIPNFRGVIVRKQLTNVYFLGYEEGGGNQPPLCSSQDGFIGITQNGQRRDCSSCEYAQWGSNGKGKACKNKKLLYILADGCQVPLILTLPPTSLKVFQDYETSLTTMLKTIGEVVTEFSLSVDKNVNGIAYSVVKFKALGSLSTELRDKISLIIKNNVPQPPRIPITAPPQPQIPQNVMPSAHLARLPNGQVGGSSPQDSYYNDMAASYAMLDDESDLPF